MIETVGTGTKLPLQETIRRARALHEVINVQLGRPNGAGWTTAADLAAPASADLEALIATARQQLCTKTPNVVGSAVLQTVQWPLIVTAVSCYLLDQRVPDLALTNVRLRFTAEWRAVGLALGRGRFTAVSGDSAANQPDVAIVPDRDALRTILLTSLETQLGFLIAQLCQRLGCHAKGLWLAVADRLAGTVLWLMPLIDTAVSPAQIEQEVAALIRVPGSPLNHRKVGVFTLTCAGRTQAFLNRATCCYWYKMEDGGYCATCPGRSRKERNRLLLQQMVE